MLEGKVTFFALAGISGFCLGGFINLLSYFGRSYQWPHSSGQWWIEIFGLAAIFLGMAGSVAAFWFSPERPPDWKSRWQRLGRMRRMLAMAIFLTICGVFVWAAFMDPGHAPLVLDAINLAFPFFLAQQGWEAWKEWKEIAQTHPASRMKLDGSGFAESQ